MAEHHIPLMQNKKHSMMASGQCRGRAVGAMQKYKPGFILRQEDVNTGLTVMFTWRDVEFVIVTTLKPRMERGRKMNI